MKTQFLKSKPVCKVTFHLPPAATGGARTVTPAGEFNDRDPGKTTLKKRKDGAFSITPDLNCNREYQFRYLIDGTRRENDRAADKYLPSPVGAEDNSVVVIQLAVSAAASATPMAPRVHHESHHPCISIPGPA